MISGCQRDRRALWNRATEHESFVGINVRGSTLSLRDRILSAKAMLRQSSFAGW
jgi:hypothetical protein